MVVMIKVNKTLGGKSHNILCQPIFLTRVPIREEDRKTKIQIITQIAKNIVYNPK